MKNFATNYLFSPGVATLISRAEHLVERLNHADIRSEHLLTELLRDLECQAIKVLVALGLDPEQCLAGLERVVLQKDFVPQDFLWSAEAERVFLMAGKEANRRPPDKAGEPNVIGDRELLIGFIRCGDGVAYEVLNRHGIYLNVLREKFGFPQDVWKRSLLVSSTPA